MKRNILSILMLLTMLVGVAETVKVGNGSYTTTFPGVDKAGRNGYPTDAPLVSGNAAGRPVPSNDWWSKKLTTPHPENLFNYPLGFRTEAEGLGIQRTVFQQATASLNPVLVGVVGVSQDAPTVCDYSDWTVTFSWENNAGSMKATVGIGMPFVYFTKKGSGEVCVTVQFGSISINGNIATVSGSYNGAGYAIYAPKGAKWRQEGNKILSDLAGKDYWSVAMLPESAGNVSNLADKWERHAFAIPKDTRVEWEYNPARGKVTTKYIVVTENKEGEGSPLLGLLPHHWANLAGNAAFEPEMFETVRGDLCLLAADHFETELTFSGILPTLPAVTTTTNGYSQTEEKRLIDLVINDDGLQDWTDSYNDGQLFNRMVQTARIARQIGYEDGYKKLRDKIRTRLENWLTYSSSEVAFLFYYYKPWGALLGYPAGYGQDNNLNDHHFHWGYMIHAAAFLAEDDPAWGEAWAPMINLLIRDAASSDRNDTMFPYQRAFSPYAGHCWANGTATNGPGNDQESSSESMQFHSSLILWGEATGNKAVRDLGIYMYATEQSAIEEYWFDVNHRNFSPEYKSAVASRVFTNGYDNQNFWGGGIQGSYGIELYPIHAGSLYLVNNPTWAASFWRAIKEETPLLQNNTDPNTWHDTYWQFAAMLDAKEALKLYEAYPGRSLKFGISPALTYQWIHSMAKYGRPDRKITADYPLACVFDRETVRSYVVQNFGDNPLVIKFSDGYTVTAPAHTLYVANGENPDPDDEIIPDTPVNPENPGGENPGGDDNTHNPDIPTGEIIVTDNAASEGAFAGDYTITINYFSGNVNIKAKFEGEYKALAAAYIFDETSGFREISMTGEGNNTFSGKITGAKPGDSVKFRIKIAFEGGLAVTRQISYKVAAAIDAIETMNVEDTDIMEITRIDGSKVAGTNVESLIPGVYIIRYNSGETRKIIVK